jgi:phosphatidylserine synthase
MKRTVLVLLAAFAGGADGAIARIASPNISARK